MKDKLFLEEMVQKGEQARQKLKTGLTGLTLTQLNWKPNPETWSVGQCLDHLLVSDCSYFPQLKSIIEHNTGMSFWQRWSPFSGLFGKMLVTQISEQPVKKMNAPKIFTPDTSKIDMGIYERFDKHQDTLLEYISASANLDLDKIKIYSPVTKFITYSLRNAYKILIQHQHRHLNQAMPIREHREFPQ